MADPYRALHLLSANDPEAQTGLYHRDVVFVGGSDEGPVARTAVSVDGPLVLRSRPVGAPTLHLTPWTEPQTLAAVAPYLPVPRLIHQTSAFHVREFQAAQPPIAVALLRRMVEIPTLALPPSVATGRTGAGHGARTHGGAWPGNGATQDLVALHLRVASRLYARNHAALRRWHAALGIPLDDPLEPAQRLCAELAPQQHGFAHGGLAPDGGTAAAPCLGDLARAHYGVPMRDLADHLTSRPVDQHDELVSDWLRTMPPSYTRGGRTEIDKHLRLRDVTDATVGALTHWVRGVITDNGSAALAETINRAGRAWRRT